ncbi:MAG TPA: hypothetical protein VNS63_21740 [Blastocatellia bacterium]|nr:hypothetical protein [Blastocatellia bacterium]
MKLKRGLILLLLFSSMSLTSLAAAKTSESVTLIEPVKVGATQLQPGRYKVIWDGSGPEVQVTFINGKKTIATAPAKLVNQESPYDGAVETKTSDDNSKLLHGISWKKRALIFDQSDSASGT